jgi:hypothetical protein
MWLEWMRSKIVGISGDRATVHEAVGGFSVFLASRISHCLCTSQVYSVSEPDAAML